MDSLPPELVSHIVTQCDPLDIPNLFAASRLFHVFPPNQRAELYKRCMECVRRDLIFYKRLLRPRQVIRTLLTDDGDHRRETIHLSMAEKLEQFTTCTACGALVVKCKLSDHLAGPWCAYRRSRYDVCETCHLAKPSSHFRTKTKCIACDHVGKEPWTCVECLNEIPRMYMWNHQCV